MTRTLSTHAKDSQIKPTDLVRFHQALAQWYKTHGRHDLPWRQTTDPYRIWLSEVMLQQTQVQTVRDRFYPPFLVKFPNIEALAAAPREAVMKAWEGLGYYRRAGNLHEAAKLVSSSRARPGISRNTLPLFPTAKEYRTRQEIPGRARDDALIEALIALPGIGKNTAHAILAFAYHQPVAILEANVKRVVARIFALEAPGDTALWAQAEMLLNRAQPFDYNQAMMDLGALICTPKAPKCSTCPANRLCKGKSAPERYPAPKRKKVAPTREMVVHVHTDARGRLFLEKRDAALLGGLYGFPQSPIRADDNAIPGEGYLGTVTHVYSHFKLIGHVVQAQVRSKPNTPDWHSREEIAALPLSALDHKVLALVDNCHSPRRKKPKATAVRRKG